MELTAKSPIKKRIKQACLVAGISETELYQTLKAQFPTKQEQPEDLDFFSMQRIAKMLKVPVAYFYTEDDILAELIRRYDALPQAARRAFLSFWRDTLRP